MYNYRSSQNGSAKELISLLINFSLKKDFSQRPNYKQLLEHPFIRRYETLEVDVSSFVMATLDECSETS